MWSTNRACSNPIYDLIHTPTPPAECNQPLMIDIEASSYPCSTSNPRHLAPLLLLADNLTTRPTAHNYVNQRIDDERENHDPVYAKPRKRCATLRNEPVIIPPKTSRCSVTSVKPERAQVVVSTTMPPVTVLSSIQQTDEIDRFVARENDRVERVKLRRRQHRQIPTATTVLSPSPLPAFSNPNYVDIPLLSDDEHLSKSILV